MNLKEIRDMFMSLLEVEKMKRGIGGAVQMNLDERLIAYWMSAAQMDILQKIQPNKKVQDYTFFKGVNIYALPTDFGMDYSVEVAGSKLDKTPLRSIQTLDGDTAEGIPQKYSVVYSNTYTLIIVPTPQSDTSGRVWYYENPGLYAPSNGTNQYWGTYDGQEYSGVIKLNDEFIPAILKYMLSQIFDDVQPEYYRKIQELKELESVKAQVKINYRFGVKRR